MYNTQAIHLHGKNKTARACSLGEVENASLLDNNAKDYMKKEDLNALGLCSEAREGRCVEG